LGVLSQDAFVAEVLAVTSRVAKGIATQYNERHRVRSHQIADAPTNCFATVVLDALGLEDIEQQVEHCEEGSNEGTRYYTSHIFTHLKPQRIKGPISKFLLPHLAEKPRHCVARNTVVI
jgi:hypothetical protein